ncbi:50S ribosomal protein L35 [Calothrix sp. NIES-4071]|nr:50S ribosomal protein L35 [Calothrix sp. NIES-4071]BAZ59180.1 50S ribosomal protein L35 [Calothrix sp. NIES-4105]
MMRYNRRNRSNILDCVVLKPIMPKLKTRKAAAKRFRATGSGKIVRRKAFKNHLLEHKSSKKKRDLSKMPVVNECDAENVRMMLPYL